MEGHLNFIDYIDFFLSRHNYIGFRPEAANYIGFWLVATNYIGFWTEGQHNNRSRTTTILGLGKHTTILGFGRGPRTHN